MRQPGNRLLAARLIGVLPIFDAQGQTVYAFPQVRQYVEPERHLPAPVVPDLLTVNPHRSTIVDRPEMKQNVLLPPLKRHLKTARIPDDFMYSLLVQT